MPKILIIHESSDTGFVIDLLHELSNRGHIAEPLVPDLDAIDWGADGFAKRVFAQVIGPSISRAGAIAVLFPDDADRVKRLSIFVTSLGDYVVAIPNGPTIVTFAFGKAPSPLLLMISTVLFRIASRSPVEVSDQIEKRIAETRAEREQQEQARAKVAERIESTASAYIERSRKELGTRETSYRRIAYLWYVFAFLSLGTGAGFAIWRTFTLPLLSGWLQLAELSGLGLVVIGMLVGVSKLAFGLGKDFMVEALRNAERSHAISFGEFYLKAFGEDAKWAEVKDVFQNWNVDKGSSFATQDATDYDPQFLKTVVQVVRALPSTEEK